MDSLLTKANVISYTQSDARSIAYLDSVYNTFSPGIMDRYRKYEAILQMLTMAKNDFPAAKLYADSIQAMIEGNNAMEKYKKEYARAYFFHGDISRAEKKYDEAFAYYFKGKILVEEVGDTCAFYQYPNKIANVYYDQQRFKEAGENYRKTYEALSHCNDGASFNELFVERQGNLCNVGICFMGRQMPDSALYYYNAALDFIQQNEGKYPDKKRFMMIARAVIEGHMADVYKYTRESATAESLLKKSIAVNIQKGNDNQYAQYSQHKLISLYLETGELDKARVELQSLRSSLDTLANESMEIQWYDLLSQYFLKGKDAPNAYKSFRNYVSLRDSLTFRRTKEANVDQILDKMQYDHNLAMIRKEGEVNRLYLIITGITMLMALMIAWLIYQNGKRTRRNVKELRLLNGQIAEQNIQMQNALTSLEQSQQQNTNMMKIVAHDLRSPIGAVQLATSSLLEDSNHTADQRRILEMINTSLSDSVHLIGNLLFSNVQTDDNRKQVVELHSMITHCVDMLRYKAREKRQRFILDIEPVTAFIDREKMWRVISNLIGNAIKFSPPEESITIELRQLDDIALFTVEDHGIGIPPEMGEKIFNLYTESKRSGTSGEQSFGMGLAISRQIVKSHNGNLWYESEQGKGTTFFVELPIGSI